MCSQVLLPCTGFYGAVSCGVNIRMELAYEITQSTTDRLTFYLVPNLRPTYNGEAMAYASSLEGSGLSREQSQRLVRAWLEHKALMVLNTHAIGKWCRDPQRCQRVLVATGEDARRSKSMNGAVRIRFISAADATLFKLTFA